MVYTGYFNALKSYPLVRNRTVMPLSVAIYGPPWYRGPVCSLLTPPTDLLRRYKEGTCSIDHYIEEYVERILRPLDSDPNIRSKVEKFNGRVLLCWEGPKKFCHRHLIASWLEMKYGLQVKEMQKE